MLFVLKDLRDYARDRDLSEVSQVLDTAIIEIERLV
jgi:hypothetical protein